MWQQVPSGELLAQREIDSRADFFHVGGTSLLLIELQGFIRERFSWAPLVHELSQSSTLETMVSVLSRGDGDGGNADANESDLVDWEAESALLPNTTYGEHKEQQKERRTGGGDAVDAGPGKTVVLTRTTGFLGQHMLGRLLKDESVQKFYCIAVRKDKADLPAASEDRYQPRRPRSVTRQLKSISSRRRTWSYTAVQTCPS